ncbi:MAG: hypothetical protein FWD66_06715 [Paludibacter sp.]|nr:hypothetical protein [Paludibacter sp.]
MFKSAILLIGCIAVLSACVPAMRLTEGGYFNPNPKYYRDNVIAYIERVDDVVEINWEKEGYKYNLQGYNNLPYVFITNEAEYDSLRIENSANIDFGKFVLFSGLFCSNTCNTISHLSLIRRDNNMQYFMNFGMYRQPDLPTNVECKEIISPVTFLIPCNFFNYTQTVSFSSDCDK